jgi:hypothetical protein
VSVQTPAQRVRELGQPDDPPHELFTQEPLEQTIPQPPQFSGSDDAFTHAPPPQLMSGAAHEHVPDTHVVPPVHVMPQPPQFRSSVETSTHAPAQSARVDVQLVAHPPLLQTLPLGQAFGH